MVNGKTTCKHTSPPPRIVLTTNSYANTLKSLLNARHICWQSSKCSLFCSFLRVRKFSSTFTKKWQLPRHCFGTLLVNVDNHKVPFKFVHASWFFTYPYFSTSNSITKVRKYIENRKNLPMHSKSWHFVNPFLHKAWVWHNTQENYATQDSAISRCMYHSMSQCHLSEWREEDGQVFIHWVGLFLS